MTHSADLERIYAEQKSQDDSSKRVEKLAYKCRTNLMKLLDRIEHEDTEEV